MRYAKLNDKAVTPTYATPGSAGLDFFATEVVFDEKERFIQYHTGIAVEIPKGHVGLLFSLSGSTKTDLVLKNGVGVIDSDYRGEIIFRFQEASSYIKRGLEMISKFIGSVAQAVLSDDKQAIIVKALQRLNNEGSWMDSTSNIYKVGDRIGQMVILPIWQVNLQQTDEESLSKTERGKGNFGHTNETVYNKTVMKVVKDDKDPS